MNNAINKKIVKELSGTDGGFGPLVFVQFDGIFYCVRNEAI